MNYSVMVKWNQNGVLDIKLRSILQINIILKLNIARKFSPTALDSIEHSLPGNTVNYQESYNRE